MFFSLLLVTFTLACGTAALVHLLFRQPIQAILEAVIDPELGGAWQRYILFALYVVGISGGVRLYDLERYITGLGPKDAPLRLTTERWTLEAYRTIIETLQSIAWMLLVFFGLALIAFVIRRGLALRRGSRDDAA
ncbi:hypothetical protein [Salisaeta longa]|uniref:hypothetical protein n=1 Tax=Salisaeta longa TaxID=503170 RepID=UPI0003B75740|nr:hypothetical protein [Salisaeta longa]